MAEIDYYEEGPLRAPRASDGIDSPGAGPGLAALINWAGALTSVALVAGMAIWAWQLTVRDVSGVPVIRALEGPMRVAPEDPGGTIADHQGLAVNRIAEGQEAAPAADRIVLAPAPVELEEIGLENSSRPATASDEQPDTMALIDRLLQEATPLEPLADSPGQAAGRDQPAATAATTTVAAAAAAAAAGSPLGPAIEVISADVPGVRVSLRPRARPAGITTASLPAASDTGTDGPAAPQDLDPAALTAGTRLVQLGAFDDADTARTEWERLTGQFPDYFADKDRVVQRAISGGREFFRLRAHGFSDLSDARRFCTALLAQGAACIPVTVR